jgi:hypothetical protein
MKLERVGLTLAVVALGGVSSASVVKVDRGSDLQAVIEHAANGDTLKLGAKVFETRATRFTDPLCGNCLDPQTSVSATYGFIIKNKALVLVGADREQTRLVTNAGYGLYIENADGTVIQHLTVTGGVRDDDGNATDAAIVVRRSRVTIERVDIRNNRSFERFDRGGWNRRDIRSRRRRDDHS